jgi:hypothetical protein
MEKSWLSCLRIVVLAAFMASLSSPAFAQSGNACTGPKAGSVACLTVDLLNSSYQQFGLPPGAPGTFITGIPALAGQLSAAAPLPSPASGFVYTFDPNAGVFVPSTTASYGPILSERAETIGRRSFSFGLVDQYFNFTRLDGVNVSNIPIAAPFAASGYLAGNYNLKLRLNQFTMFGSYGITDFLDASFAAPVIRSEFDGSLFGRLRYGPIALNSSTTFDRSATGFGDLQFQVKANLIPKKNSSLALGVNIRTATGDPYALTGAGAAGIQPFIAASTTIRRVAPHVNVAYQYNGKSVLAGDVTTGEKRNLPGNISYAAGAEIVVNRRLTIAEDILGTELIHAPRLYTFNTQVFDGSISGAGFVNQSFNATNLSSGLKFNPGGHFLFTLNFLTRMNSGGLRASFVPLVGLSYVRQAPPGAALAARRETTPTVPDRVAPPPADNPPAVVGARPADLQPQIDRMVQELASQANFVPSVAPALTPFHNGRYLKLSIAVTLPRTAAGSQYRLAALAFDQQLSHLVRPIVAYFNSRQDFEGINFSAAVRLAGDQSPDASALPVEFIFPLAAMRSYAQFDLTGQQLIDGGFVLINGERVSLNLQIAEGGFSSPQ